MRYRENIKNFLFIVSLAVLGFLVLDIPSGFEPVIFRDSSAYLSDTLSTGVVPVYLLFIKVNYILLGEKLYLQGVILEQIVLAIVSSIFFVLLIKREFRSNYLECYIFFFLTFVPYTIFLSGERGMACRLIATEALAFPLFYVMVIVMLNGIWKNNIWYLVGAEALTIGMALTRTQLQLTLLFPAGAFFLLWIQRRIGKKYRRHIIQWLSGAVLSIVVFGLAFVVFQQSNRILENMLYHMTQDIQESGEVRAELKSQNETTKEDRHTESKAVSNNITSQYSSILFPKMILTAREKDKELFQDGELRRVFEYLYNRMLEDQLILEGMDRNLFLGDKIHEAISENYANVVSYLEEFKEIYPDFQMSINEIMKEISMTLLKEHPVRWFSGSVLQMPSGFISTVFFHRRNAYWLCYFIAFWVYCVSIGIGFAGKWKTWGAEQERDFLFASVLMNAAFVIITSIVFVCFKRYVIYGFGIFYISLYLSVKRLGQNILKGWRSV